MRLKFMQQLSQEWENNTWRQSQAYSDHYIINSSQRSSHIPPDLNIYVVTTPLFTIWLLISRMRKTNEVQLIGPWCAMIQRQTRAAESIAQLHVPSDIDSHSWNTHNSWLYRLNCGPKTILLVRGITYDDLCDVLNQHRAAHGFLAHRFRQSGERYTATHQHVWE